MAVACELPVADDVFVEFRRIICFLSPVNEVKSIKWFTLLDCQDMRKPNFFLIFSVLVCDNLNSSFHRDDKSCVCSSSKLLRFCGSFESCENIALVMAQSVVSMVN